MAPGPQVSSEAALLLDAGMLQTPPGLEQLAPPKAHLQPREFPMAPYSEPEPKTQLAALSSATIVVPPSEPKAQLKPGALSSTRRVVTPLEMKAQVASLSNATLLPPSGPNAQLQPGALSSTTRVVTPLEMKAQPHSGVVLNSATGAVPSSEPKAQLQPLAPSSATRTAPPSEQKTQLQPGALLKAQLQTGVSPSEPKAQVQPGVVLSSAPLERQPCGALPPGPLPLNNGIPIQLAARLESKQRHCCPAGRFCCSFVFCVSLRDAEEFSLVSRLIGKNGANTRLISDRCSGKVRIRGRGSGWLEGPQKREAALQLQVALSCTRLEDYEIGRQLLTSQLCVLAADYKKHCQRKKMRPPKRFYVLVEKSVDGKVQDPGESPKHPLPSQDSERQ